MEMLYTSRGIYNFIDVDMGARKDVEDNGLMYKVKMLEKNHIPYLVSPYENEIDGRFFLRYNTDSNYVLERLLQKIKPDGNFLKLVFNQIIQCVNGIPGYLLNPNDIVVDPSYMFFDHTKRELRMICVPGYGQNLNVQIKTFLEYIMRIFDHRDQDGVKYLYELYENVTEENFSLYEYGHIQMEKKLTVVPAAPSMKAEECRMPAVDVTKKNEEVLFEEEQEFDKGYICIAVVFAVSVVMGIKFVLGGRDIMWLAFCITGLVISAVMLVSAIGRTRDRREIDESMVAFTKGRESQEVLNEQFMQTPVQPLVQQQVQTGQRRYRLVPLNNGYLEPIDIREEKQEITIGRGKKENDYRLSGSQISRIHARVYRRDENLYLKDAGSTNGTFVNSVRLSEDDEVRLNRGDMVAFATEEFFVS